MKRNHESKANKNRKAQKGYKVHGLANPHTKRYKEDLEGIIMRTMKVGKATKEEK